MAIRKKSGPLVGAGIGLVAGPGLSLIIFPTSQSGGLGGGEEAIIGGLIGLGVGIAVGSNYKKLIVDGNREIFHTVMDRIVTPKK